MAVSVAVSVLECVGGKREEEEERKKGRGRGRAKGRKKGKEEKGKIKKSQHDQTIINKK